jgi:hypothetical protein
MGGGGRGCFLLQYDRRLVMPWLVDNAIMCGLLFLIVVGGSISCVILTASQLKDDLTTLTHGFLILVPGSFFIGNADHTLYALLAETCEGRIFCGLICDALGSCSI